MYKAEFSIKLLTIAGAHRPINLLSIEKILYNIFTVFVIILLYSYNISLFIYVTLYSINDIDDLSESLCWSLAFFDISVIMINFLSRRDDIIKLINILNEDCLKTRDNKEKIMQHICDSTARRNTKYFFITGYGTGLALIFGGLAKGKNNINLPLKASFPYDYNQKLAFSLTYIGQCLFIHFSAFISIACATFVMTMLIQICSQLDIIYHRLQSLSYCNMNFNETQERKIIKNCIVHSNHVYMFSRKLKDIFSIIFGIQFFASIINICTLVFSLSNKNEINDRVIVQSMALIAFLFQLFLYCHFGNEVMLKSLKLANVMSIIDWTSLTKNTKQGLLLISLRASKPIIITSGYVIPMTYDTFFKILKTSYAAYNVLQNAT